MRRRLAAILAADVVGYTRLMAGDETGTLRRLTLLRVRLLEPLIDEHHGRIVKLMGDGLLVEFASAVDALSCALAWQGAVAEHEADRDVDMRFRFRIGINLGDVIVEGEDIHGDGVDIAARLESLAEPGGIWLAGEVYRLTRGRSHAEFEDMGEQALKNVAEPVRVYRWTTLPPGPTAPTSPSLSLTEKPSIAVLPFANLSGDLEQEYFADGITEDLTLALGRCRWLLVIARNSAFAYKGKSIDTRRVSEELGVRYVVEGSVRKSGHRIRVSAELIDGRDGARLWGERYDREIGDVFALQDEITAVIAGTIEPELESIERTVRGGRTAVDLNAWDCYQRGLWHLYRFTVEDLEKAKTPFERAIALDPNFSQAHARLAYVQIQLDWYGPRKERAGRVKEAALLAAKAVDIDGRDPSARLSLGRALTLSGEVENGIEELRAAVTLDPSFAQAHFALGQALCSVDRHEEALREIDASIQLSPRDPHMWTFLHVRAIAHYIADELELAEADDRAAMRQPNATFYPYTVLAAILGRAGKIAEAQEAISRLHRLRPGFSCADAIDEWHFGDHPIMTRRFVEQFASDLRAAGLPE